MSFPDVTIRRRWRYAPSQVEQRGLSTLLVHLINERLSVALEQLGVHKVLRAA